MKSKNGGLLRVPALKGFHIFLDAYTNKGFMEKYFYLLVALVAILLIIWALIVPDYGMFVLLSVFVLFCYYGHYKYNQ